MKFVQWYIDHDFYIRVQKLRKNTCQVNLPDIVLYEPLVTKSNIIYEIKDNHISYQDLTNDQSRKLILPDYAKRAIIMIDVIIKSIQRDISTDLIVIFNEKEEIVPKKQFLNLFEEYDNPENKEKETKLIEYFQNYLLGNDAAEILEEYDIESGGELVCNLFQTGGIV